MSTVHLTIDSYAVLGVSQIADIKEINAVYKRLALKSHPDKAGGTEAAIERFREIADAVELLRDPVRRRQLDQALNKYRWSRREPEEDLPPESAYAYHGNHHARRRGRNRRRRRGTALNPESFSHRNIFDVHNDSDYMHSFGNSVHMDPNSEESKAKCAQFKAENDQWEREWQGIDPEMEKLREEYSKENMPSQTVRARDDMATEVGDKFDSGVFCSARTAFTVFGTFEKELHAGTDPGRSKPANLTASHHAGNEPGNIYVKEKDGDRLYWPHSSSSYARHDSTGDEHGYKVSTEARHSSKSTGRHSSHKRCASCEATAGWENEVPVDKSIDYDSAGDDPGGKLTDEAVHSVNAADGFLPYKRSISCQCTVGSVDENIVQTSAAKSDNTIEQASKCPSAGSTNLIDSFPPLCPANKISSDDPSDRESYINSHLGDCEALQHLIPFFQQKVREHPDSYTTNDLYGELNGLILETYSNWVEGLRSSFADAQSSDFVNDQAACAHLGSWQKKFNRADCDQCHLCKPLYVLTCPGCGLKACIRCKFTDAY